MQQSESDEERGDAWFRDRGWTGETILAEPIGALLRERDELTEKADGLGGYVTQLLSERDEWKAHARQAEKDCNEAWALSESFRVKSEKAEADAVSAREEMITLACRAECLERENVRLASVYEHAKVYTLARAAHLEACGRMDVKLASDQAELMVIKAEIRLRRATEAALVGKAGVKTP